MSQSLISMIRDITYYYIKFYYDKELKDTMQQKLEEQKLKDMIHNLYITNSVGLKKYIRDTLKDNMGNNYNSFAIENIILEMFTDPEYSKHRVFIEITEFQKQSNVVPDPINP